MAKWLEQASQWHEIYCHDLVVMSLNPIRIELGVRSTSVVSRTWTKNIINIAFKAPSVRKMSEKGSEIAEPKIWVM